MYLVIADNCKIPLDNWFRGIKGEKADYTIQKFELHEVQNQICTHIELGFDCDAKECILHLCHEYFLVFYGKSTEDDTSSMLGRGIENFQNVRYRDRKCHFWLTTG